MMDLLSHYSHPVIALAALLVMFGSVPALLVWGVTRAATERPDPMARLLDSVADVQADVRRAAASRLPADPRDPRTRSTTTTRRTAA